MSSEFHALYVKICGRCNDDCVFCATIDSRDAPDRPIESIRSKLQIGREHGYSILTLSGGEPTVVPNLVDIVSYAHELGYDWIQMQTNARALRSEQYTRSLVEAGMTEFQISVHGHTAEIHEAITRRRGSFAQTVSGIKNAVALNTEGYNSSNTIIARPNGAYMPEMVRFLVDLGITNIQLSFVQIESKSPKVIKDFAPRMTEVAPYLMRAIDLADEIGCRIIIDAIPYCIMPGYEKYVVNTPTRDPHTVGVDQAGAVYDEGMPDKVKSERCAACIYHEQCGGVWPRYYELHGLDEFEPRVSPTYPIPERR
jgi:MoaA/NifB/PqqE/SkfB family radical SAM enzyme